MKKEALQIVKTIILAVIIGIGAQIASAAWTSAPANPPSNNVDAPINTSAFSQFKRGPLIVNTTTDNPRSPGLSVWQGLEIKSTVPDITRLFIDENGDSTSSHFSGVELRDSGIRRGGLFKKGDTNEIGIWNASKPVVTVKQDDTTEFAGTIKINGGNPGAGKVLTSDAAGNATWQPGGNGSVVPWFYTSSSEARKTVDMGSHDFCALTRVHIASTDDDNTNISTRSPYCHVQANGNWFLHSYYATCEVMCF